MPHYRHGPAAAGAERPEASPRHLNFVDEFFQAPLPLILRIALIALPGVAPVPSLPGAPRPSRIPDPDPMPSARR